MIACLSSNPADDRKTSLRDEAYDNLDIAMSSIIKEIAGSAKAIVKGMGITFGEMLQPTITDDYPDGPPKFMERYRGAHVLQRDENGMEKCVACFLCAAACPADCIYIEAAENTDQVRISGGERYASVYNIDYNRCIFCGYCVEACPTDAITHGHGFELASYDTSTLVIRKEQMLVSIPVGAKPVTELKEPAAAGH
jgi:NADH-quinone oxidoreductase subunit I